MAERRQHPERDLTVPAGRALIGLVFEQDGRDVTRYFADDAAADAATAGAMQEALALVGAWSDLDWEEIEESLDRIRHESSPSPPIEV
jgi:hypothetical protein